jgi:ubiquinone/menaquinone biosynthesis C-methylase UbiE
MSFIYDIFDHRDMLLDRIRMNAYRQAIQATVRQGDVVADLGTGTGIMAFLAAQAGAKKVYAIEKEEIISVAAKVAESNGMLDRIVFINRPCEEVELPEPVDVIISEFIGVFGLEENLLPHIIYAHRFLKPGGSLLPAWLDLYLTPVESPELWDATVGLWCKDFYGLDFSPVRSRGVSERYVIDCLGKFRRLASEFPLAHLDFYTLTKIPTSFRMRIPLESAGTLHGYVGYFKVGVSPRTVISTSPEEPPTHWKQAFFPLPEPVEVQAGDLLECEITNFQIRRVYWRWDTKIIRRNQQQIEFSQHNWQISKEQMMISKKEFVPSLDLKGEMQKLILDSCNGRRTLTEIAEILQEVYPEQYCDLEEALTATVSNLQGKISI